MDSLQPALDRRWGHGSEHDCFASGSNGLGELLGMRRGEHQVGSWRRFFEGLEHVVRRLFGEPIGSSDDGNTTPAGVGGEREELLQRRAGFLVAGLALRRGVASDRSPRSRRVNPPARGRGGLSGRPARSSHRAARRPSASAAVVLPTPSGPMNSRACVSSSSNPLATRRWRAGPWPITESSVVTRWIVQNCPR